MAKIIPAILSNVLSDYQKFALIYREFSDEIHIDYMDGIYVKSKSPGIKEILSLEDFRDMQLNIHVMASDPKNVLDTITNHKNTKIVYIHADVFDYEFLEYKRYCKIALALSPKHLVDDYKDLIHAVDAILILTVTPGSQGSEFLQQNLEKIEKIRKNGFKGEIHVDGHVNSDTVSTILKHKPDVLVVGSAIQQARDPIKAFEEIRSKLAF